MNYDIKEDVTTEMADHEVLISFGNDVHGIAFREWITGEGMKQFERWFSENEEKFIPF